MKALAQSFYGIRNTELIQATGLDLVGADPETILRDCEQDILRRFGD